MAIQNRRGKYGDFDPTKMRPGEFAVVQTNDPNVTDGKAVYIAFAAGDVKRMATHDELHSYDENARIAAENAEESRANAQHLYEQTLAQKNAADQSAAAAAASADDAAGTLEEAIDAINTAKTAAQADITATKDTAIADVQADVADLEAEVMERINARGEQIVAITTQADQTAAEALAAATNAENHMASLDSQMQQLETALSNVSIDPDDLGLEQDEDTYYVYPTYKGVRSENGIPLASSGGGGGGGGGDVIGAVLTVTNTSGWLSKTIASGSSCPISLQWSSVEDGMATGDGNIRIAVNEVVRTTYQVKQGVVSLDLAPYLSAGQNKVKVRISDTYDQGKTITFNITSIGLSISSTFDASTVYNAPISFPYTPVGAVEKTVHFILDGKEIGTQVTSVSGRQMSFTIPAQSHGSHALRVYFEATINNETVRSNELYYEFIYVEPLNNTVIITSSFNSTTQPQYASIAIPFMVYNPASLTADITIKVNGTAVSTQTVDRTEHSYTYRANDPGTLTIAIESGKTTKTIQITVTESDIDVEAETENLALYLSSQGRSNAEANPGVWEYNDISCGFTNFTWTSDGWQKDEDNISVLRVSGDARLTIPYQIFAQDFRTTGKTIELEFATRNILNYDSTILSCMSGGRGLSLTAQKAILKSEQSEIGTQYKEDEHVRIAFVVDKRAEDRIIYVYINGIASGAIRYPEDDNFQQTSPVGITIGSSDCTIDLYCIRVYDNNLTRFQIVDNWIADTQVGAVMLERYTHNNVFDDYGSIIIANLPSDLPYMIITCAELPQFKGDKKTCSGSFINPMYPSKSFTFTGAQIDVQGTSSAGYPRKNYKIKFKNGIEMTVSGAHADKYAMTADAIPTNCFCFKADFASSEGANNVELVRLYNSACPYKTPAQIANPKVRQGIDGFPMVMFWNDTATGSTTFIGKYNFNNDKSTEEVFGLADPDESWETLNNTGDRVLWKGNDYESTITDEKGNVIPAWTADFEARYPDTDPAYTDATQLKEFATWVMSTDTEAATGAALEAPVTYAGVEYTNDTAEYRLAKFRAEAGDYMELDSTLFYYLFTEVFLMVDSRAKNAFPSFIGSEVSA